jgi:hypothetical protein
VAAWAATPWVAETPGRLLAAAAGVARLRSQLEALHGCLVLDAARLEAYRAPGYATVDEAVADMEFVTSRQSRGMRHSAEELADSPLVERAAIEGAVTRRQADTAVQVMAVIGEQLTDEQRVEAQRFLVPEVSQLVGQPIADLAERTLEHVVPGLQLDRTRRNDLQDRTARSRRYMSFSHRRDGTTRFSGLLPVGSGRQVERAVEAFSRRVTLDPAERPSRGKRLADGFVALCGAALRGGTPPKHAGATPTVNVTVPMEDLLDGTRAAGWSDGDETRRPLSAAALRLLACAGPLRLVATGADGTVVGAGEARRFVDDSLRAVLDLRDEGCQYPGCAEPPWACEAHHIMPWQAGGPTVAGNLLLLCRTHHEIVEPALEMSWDGQMRLDRSGWNFVFDDAGYPMHVKPSALDPTRTPRYHERHEARVKACGPPAPGGGDRERSKTPARAGRPASRAGP